MATTNKTGYCNGSDMLVYIGTKAVGHCTSHSVSLSSETKDRAVKPVASASIKAGLSERQERDRAQHIDIGTEGLVFYGETESGYKALYAAWKTGQSVDVKCMERESSDKPYLKGKFVITSLERTDPANDDSTYSVTFENDGEPDTLDDTAITETPDTVQAGKA